MPPSSLVELKRALVREGFEIYRMSGHFVLLADRVRDNLIMDSGVALGLRDPDRPAGTAAEGSESLVVRIVLKAQSSEFPNENAEQLFGRARQLAGPFASRGYREAGTQALAVQDPGDPSRIIDTWHEISWELPVSDLVAAVAELRFALEQQKATTAPAEE